MRKILDSIEHYGNKIPHPSLMFLFLCLCMLVISFFAQLFGWSSVNPVSQETINARSLVTGDGLRFILTSMVTNFTHFAPLGVVLVAMLGIGIADKSGLLDELLRSVVKVAKGKGLTFTVAFAGVMSSLAADSGYVILVPLSAMLYVSAGRPAIAGIATAFAAVSGGYSANLLVGPIDAVLAGLSTESIQLIEPAREVTATANWYFNIVSTFFIAGIVTLVTERGQWSYDANATQFLPSVDAEKMSLKGLGIYSAIFIIILLILTVPENAILRDPETQSLARSPFIQSIVVIIALYFAGAGMIFGFRNNTFSNSTSVIHAMEDTMKTMSGYLVMMFFAAQFVAWFKWSNLGLIVAIEGAGLLSGFELNNYFLLVLFILLSGMINIFIGSSSAQWALMAPVFVPMLYVLGIDPETSQAAYRIGDSSTNIITPMMPYFALVLAFLQKHDKSAGMGTLIATMLPYSLAFIVFWTILLLVFLATGIPLGI